ncbi:hypothetical protein M422DRAFT_256251 [Sphaerobolus stellatus SS14]|uniref:Uncharacterized protein n=1 Tax=Sphaerobolus stellatus (strain SS14) TaxID=990650 RepID=A0A0C9VS30_SPHS4|nr:hypothetical protein M422DRAFT_256251 [Sphaerobolus stellatus SS14]
MQESSTSRVTTQSGEREKGSNKHADTNSSTQIKAKSPEPKSLGQSSSSQRNITSKGKPTQHSKLKSSRVSGSDTEYDSDNDIVDELQVLFSGDATQVFVGEHQLAAVDWKCDEATEYGPTTIESARFIESGERFPEMNFHRILDLGQPIQTLDDDVYDLIFNTASPQPDVGDFLHVKWDLILVIFLARIDNAVSAIKYHSRAGGEEKHQTHTLNTCRSSSVLPSMQYTLFHQEAQDCINNAGSTNATASNPVTNAPGREKERPQTPELMDIEMQPVVLVIPPSSPMKEVVAQGPPSAKGADQMGNLQSVLYSHREESGAIVLDSRSTDGEMEAAIEAHLPRKKRTQAEINDNGIMVDDK